MYDWDVCDCQCCTGWFGLYPYWGCAFGEIYAPCILLACQVRVTVGDFGFCCCIRVTSFEQQLSPLLKWLILALLVRVAANVIINYYCKKTSTHCRSITLCYSRIYDNVVLSLRVSNLRQLGTDF